MGAATERMAAMQAEQEFLSLCVPLQEELDAAKSAYRQALDDGVESEIKAARERKNAAALALREFRQWAREADAGQDAGEGSASVPTTTVTGKTRTGGA